MSEKPEKKSFIRRFFGGLWTLIVNIYRGAVILGFFVFLFMLWTAVQGGPARKVDDNLALVIWPSGDLVDQLDNDPSQRFIEELSGEPPSQTRLRDLIEAFETAADDDRIPLAVLKLDNLWSASIPQLEELAAAMKKFQARNKPIYAYGPSFDQTGYLAAAHADDVSMDPYGGVFLEGLGVYQNYFKEGLDKLGVEMHVFRVGEYKSAVEPFTRMDMSEEAKAQNREWLQDLWQGYDRSISAGRKLDPGAADRYVASFRTALEQQRGDAGKVAQAAGLVNRLETLPEFRRRVAETVGEDQEHGSFRQIHYREYLRAVGHERKSRTGSRNELALVTVQGEIVDGPGEAGQAGGETVSELLEEARRDEEVAAVVLRVDSPGGSVWASEQIRRAVQALRADGKPVVVSMSSVAASGGYWVSMDADRIFAHESTITGSIGIFGLIPTIEKPLAKLGIRTDGVGTTALAGSFRIDRPLSDDVKAIIQTQIEKGYRDFIEGVAKARKLEVAKVDEIARGRVWSGADAKGLGLVDELGGLEQATAAAAALAGLQEGDWKLEPFEPTPQTPLDFLGGFFSHIGVRLDLLPAGMQTQLREWLSRSDLGRALGFMTDPRGIYAHCFCAPSLGERR